MSAPVESRGEDEAVAARRVALWDAINRYVVACGGDPSRHVYGNTARMKAVAEVERIALGKERAS